MELYAHIDGSSMGNPGEAGYGVVIRDDRGSLLELHGRYIGRATNNVAEYQGLIGCLERIRKYRPNRLTVYSDSQLLVRQITGEYRVKQPHLQKLREEIERRIRDLSLDFSIHHVPREQNAEADRLARKAVNAKGEISE
ncbi:ribonuclease HI family protein [bacterium]|nr:ribonuclease HI family protein [bacterium]